MCVICVSNPGVDQPTEAVMARMFQSNPHGAGYMTARNGRVEISKGFLTWEDFIHAVRYEHFTAAAPVVYHFRISTQAGTGAAMTHPFPLTNQSSNVKCWTLRAPSAWRIMVLFSLPATRGKRSTATQPITSQSSCATLSERRTTFETNPFCRPSREQLGANGRSWMLADTLPPLATSWRTAACSTPIPHTVLHWLAHITADRVNLPIVKFGCDPCACRCGLL